MKLIESHNLDILGSVNMFQQIRSGNERLHENTSKEGIEGHPLFGSQAPFLSSRITLRSSLQLGFIAHGSTVFLNPDTVIFIELDSSQ